VTLGVFWVEVPDAGLYVVCGSPPDTVKHLMRRGLIIEQEVDGVVFENGPNAVLLSDVMLQGGSFANLAEFLVLQMLYRQGMILPNHPGNTGRKPVLIGLEDQVKAQLEYIYRGNYGLVSQAEIEAAGIDSETAAEMMRMKLKFAFGEIADPSKFLDTCIVGRGPVEVVNGVAVERVDVNVYEFTYEDETAQVDLNLPQNFRYESPYPLGYHQVDCGYFNVIHSGEGDGWDINRPTMSSIICFQGKVYLVDAGPNLLAILNALGVSVSEIEGIFHTHSHDDHFAGLPTLMQTDHRIRYFATPLVRAAVTRKLTALLGMDEAEFAKYFDVRDLEFDKWNDVEGLEVMPLFSPHPVETSIFNFRALGAGGYRNYAHLADISSFNVLESMVTESENEPGISADFLERTKRDYLATANLKKLDIGGGLIHGAASDFRADKSRKIILAHTNRGLTPEEKEIGSGAPFGTIDVLIEGYQNYAWRFGFDYLRTYFSEASHVQLQILLNNPVETFNPESILIREGARHEEIYLILTGSVEWVAPDGTATGILSAGAFVGERSGLSGDGARMTYRALSFVTVLKLPASLYLEFVKENDLFDELSTLNDARNFLQETWLFGEAISQPVLHRVAKAMTTLRIRPGEEMTVEPGGLYIMAASIS